MLRRPLIVAGVAFAVWTALKAYEFDMAETVAPTPLRAAPREDARVIVDLPVGEEARILAERADWTEVRTDEGRGWVANRDIRPLP